MRNYNSEINFQSRIKLINQNVFNDKIKNLNPKKHKVGYPWTPDTMKRGKNLYTTEILDCIAGGVVDDGRVTMFHLGCWSQRQAKQGHQKGFDIKNIERRILEKINLANENLHAFIIGGFQFEPDSKYNYNKLKKIKNIFEKNNIPYSIFGGQRDVHYFGRYSIFFDNKQDTLFIANNHTNHLDCNGKNEKEMEVLGNLVTYHTYKKEPTGYKRIRHKTGILEFFKSQFREVSLCKIDEFA